MDVYPGRTPRTRPPSWVEQVLDALKHRHIRRLPRLEELEPYLVLGVSPEAAADDLIDQWAGAIPWPEFTEN